MKYLLILSFVAFCVYQLSSTEAAEVGLRSKRSLATGECPKNVTMEQCLASVREELGKTCAKLLSLGYEGTEKFGYEIEYCIYEQCSYKGQELKVTEDLSKEYPDCCPKCDFSDLPSDFDVSGLEISSVGK